MRWVRPKERGRCRAPGRIDFSITSGKRLVELCTFSARADAAGGGGTELRVGGLATYKTQQRKLLYFIPVGPKQIYGMAPYKRFLEAVAGELSAADASATVSIGVPGE